MARFLLVFLFAVSLRLVFGDSSTTSDLLWPQPSQSTFGTEVYEVDSGNFVFNTTSASTLLKSAMDRKLIMFSLYNYIHLGGDEVSFSCWQGNPDIQAWMKKMGYTDYAKLEEYYENNLIDLVNKLNKSYVVWQEIFDNGLKIKMDTVIDVWKAGWEKEMDAVTKAGYNVILSTCWYLNRISYGEDWKSYYSCDPQNFNGTDDQNSLVVGGHACLWGEWVDSTNFMSRMWPRACAVGERLWSPKTVTDVNGARTRLLNQRCRLLTRGIRAEPVGPSYCNDEWHGP
uniref:beta-N-acetylhexosaminidase n=1 Tax=Amphimedon queenslandica TaxID=400682 RepID=A0A1X7U7Y7_AMPQE